MTDLLLLGVALLSAFISPTAARASAPELLLENAQIVDPVTREIRAGSLFIRDGMIRKVSADFLKEFKGTRIDVHGEWVIPGLNDMHVHSWGNAAPNGARYEYESSSEAVASLALKAGVTGLLDLFMLEPYIFTVRDRQRMEDFVGADLFAAGALFTCTHGHGSEYAGVPARIIDSPADALREVRRYVRTRRPDVIKIVYDHARPKLYPSMNKATMTAAIKAAAALGVKTVIHIGTWQDAREAVLAGATAITHLYEQDIPDSLVTLMRQKKVYEIPTLAVEWDLVNFDDHPELLKNPLLVSVTPPELLDAYRDSTRFTPQVQAQLKWLRKMGNASYYRSLRKLLKGGVAVMTGTDAGNVGTFQAFSVHREMQLMVEAGATTWDALAAATVTPGRFWSKPYGVHPGDFANLVVLKASPIEDIRNTQEIDFVVMHGAVVDRGKLNFKVKKTN